MLFADMTVLENLQMGAYLSPGQKNTGGFSGLGIWPFPDFENAAISIGRDPQRRRAANGGDRQGIDVPAQTPDTG